MSTSSTPERILETARKLFNQRGFAATTQAAIAAEAGLTQGNLTYHFPAKRDLALALRDMARAEIHERDDAYVPGDVCGDYVRHVAFSMDLVWRYRFLLRDRAQLAGPGIEPGASPEMVADLARLDALIHRFADEGLLRRGLGVDLDVLARSLWIVSRYWLDHLDEFDGVDTITWDHFERGIAQHRAMLSPCLTAAGQRRLDDAFAVLATERRAS
ncbi:MAG: TetR family transcriptional regulator [Actinomycetota bacterium]